MGPKINKRCSCTKHDDILQETDQCSEPVVYNIKTSKKIPKSVIQVIVKEGYLSERATYLCSVCWKHFEGIPMPDVKKTKLEEKLSQKVCSALDGNELSKDEVCEIAKSLGRYIGRNESTRSVDRDILNLESHLNEDIDKSFGSMLVSFVKGLSCYNDKITNLKLKVALEQLSALINSQYIGTVHYCISLICHYITGSSNIVNLLSKSSPSVHYSTLMKDIEFISQKPTFPKDGDGVVFFDNNQILSRRWNVIYDCKSLVSVVTTLLFLQPPVSYEIQKNPNLCPYLWLSVPEDKSFCYEKPDVSKLFKTLRNKYICSVLTEVYSDLHIENGSVVDEIDTLNATDSVTKTHSPKEPINIIFNEDGEMIKVHSQQHDPYDSVESKVIGKPAVTLLDPVFENPCSYAAISKLLGEVYEMCEREWIAVGCDGLPYLLGSRVLENYIDCPECDKTFTKLNQFKAHCDTTHVDKVIDPQTCRKYKNILLVPGLGHYEMNYVKALFKLLWPVVLKELARLMGYKSLKALAHCQAATNHHKSWTLLQICLGGLSKELVFEFAKDCKVKEQIPSVSEYFKFISQNQQSDVFVFMFRVVFDYLFALDLFRKGVRRNNTEIIECSMHQLSVLFYGLNMTSYMEIDLRRQNIQYQAPPEVKRMLQDMSCMSHTGHASKGEGCDFILESYNRRTKRWMPPGAGTDKRWLRVYRNLQCIENLKTLFVSEDQDDDGFRKRDNTNAEAHWRRLIRSKGYLNPDKTFVSLSGEELDTDLLLFADKCTTNKKRYCDSFPNTCKLERLFFTPEDRRKFHDINNKTKSEIEVIIVETIKKIAEEGSELQADVLHESWMKEVKNGKKADYLNFHKECTQVHEEIRTIEDISDAEFSEQDGYRDADEPGTN